MNQTLNKIKVISLASSILLSTTIASASNAEDRHIYIGTEWGVSEPVVKGFKETVEGKTTRMRLKQSRMYGGRVGYSFYPGMMIELSGTHQPKFRLAYRLPKDPLNIEHTGQARISANVFTLNFIYEADKQFAGIKPYVLLGAGVAKTIIHAAGTSHDYTAGRGEVTQVITIHKSTKNNFVYQFGGGVTRDLGNNLSLDLGAKMQVIQDLKLKYSAHDQGTNTLKVAKPIKKTIGVGEFTLGLTFKFPV